MRLDATMLLAFLPWALILSTRGVADVTILVGLLAVVSGLGFAVLRISRLLGTSWRSELIFASGTGFMLICAASAWSARYPISGPVVFVCMCLAGIAGCVPLLRNVLVHRQEQVAAGKSIVLLSILVSVVFLFPTILTDGVRTNTGDYQWIDIDTVFNVAISASIKVGSPPSMPGMATARLDYHYGSHALAAYISRVFAFELHRAVVVMRGLGLLTLLLSTIGFSRRIGTGRCSAQLAIPAGIIGLFFFSGPLLPALCGGAEGRQIPWNFYMSSHFLIGHSTLWGLIGLCTVFGVYLVKNDCDERRARFLLLPLIATCVIPLNVFAGLAACGTMAALPVLREPTRKSNWILAMAIAMAGSLSLYMLGLVGSGMSGAVVIGHPIAGMRNMAWQLLGAGLVLYALRETFTNPRNATAMLIGIFTLGSMLYPIFIDEGPGFSDNGNRFYPMFFLHHILACCALVYLARPLQSLLREETEHQREISRALRFLFVVSTLALLTCVILDISTKKISPAWTISAGYCIVLLGLCGLLYGKRHLATIVGNATVLLLLILGLVSSITILQPYNPAHPTDVIRLSGGEYAGLRRLRTISTPNQIFATNKHEIPERKGPGGKAVGKSYLYRALSERRVLVEGWGYYGRHYPKFKEIWKDNQLIFSSTNAHAVRDVLEKYEIDFIVCRPKTDLEISRQLPPWLVKVDGTGTLTIYVVNLPARDQR